MRSKISIDFNDAQQLAAACLATAVEHAVSISVAIVDDAGMLLQFARMDGARAHTVEISTRKARAAAAAGVSTKLIDEALKAGLLSNVEAVGWGGLPVKIGTDCAGAVGISGATPDIDDAIAASALATVAPAIEPGV
jgi:glc operon protein GlcG